MIMGGVSECLACWATATSVVVTWHFLFNFVENRRTFVLELKLIIKKVEYTSVLAVNGMNLGIRFGGQHAMQYAPTKLWLMLLTRKFIVSL